MPFVIHHIASFAVFPSANVICTVFAKETNTSVTAINDVSSHFLTLPSQNFSLTTTIHTKKALQGRAIDTLFVSVEQTVTPPTRIIRGYICIGKIILFMNVSL